jgi:hypothetical protein
MMKAYFYRDQTGPGGTIIIGRLAYRWGSHLSISRGHHWQWYGRRGWKFW